MTETRTVTEEKKVHGDDKNGDSGAKKEKKRMGGINGSIPKDKEGDDFNNKNVNTWIYFYFSKIIDTNYVLG